MALPRALSATAAATVGAEWADFRDMAANHVASGVMRNTRGHIMPARARAREDGFAGWLTYCTAAAVREAFAGDGHAERFQAKKWDAAHPRPARGPLATEQGNYQPFGTPGNMASLTAYYQRECGAERTWSRGGFGYAHYCQLAVHRESVRGES